MGQNNTADPHPVVELLRKPAITAAEALKVLPISKNALYAALSRGEFDCITIGRRKLIPSASLRRLLKLSE